MLRRHSGPQTAGQDATGTRGSTVLKEPMELPTCTGTSSHSSAGRRRGCGGSRREEGGKEGELGSEGGGGGVSGCTAPEGVPEAGRRVRGERYHS